MNLKNKSLENVMRIISGVCEYIFGFICMMVLSGSLIGTIFVFFDWHWGWLAISLTAIFSCAGSVYLKKRNFFELNNFKELVSVFILGMIGLFIYIQYAPTLELHQDPALYMYKSLNLVNYGHVYQPMDVYDELLNDGVVQEIENTTGDGIPHKGNIYGYALLQNGTVYENGRLSTDFFPGGAFVYAMMGKIHKSLIFYGQTIIMLVNIGLFYFVLKNILKKKWKTLCAVPYILAFFLAPVIVFFGRGSFTEPIALTVLLFAICFLTKIVEYKKVDYAFLMFAFLILYSARMDYLLLSIIGIFVITYLNRIAGGIYSVLLLLVQFVFNSSYWIYSFRIRRDDMPILQYSTYLIIVAYIISLLISLYGKKVLEKVYFSKYIKVLYFIACIAVSCLMFHDNVIAPDNYEMAMIHGVEQMTYSEFIFDLLFLVFPSVVLVGGILCLYNILGNTKIPFVANVFIIGTITIYMNFFLGAGNSPMLYWFLRRFFYSILPILTISFAVFFMSYDKKIAGIVGIISMLLSVNLLANSNLTVDYDGLDKNVEQICEEWKEENVQIVLYDTDIRYEVSSLLAYSDVEFVPYTGNEVYDILQYFKDNDYDLNSCIVLTDDADEKAGQYQLVYNKQYEAVGDVPKGGHSVQYLLYKYTDEQFSPKLQ